MRCGKELGLMREHRMFRKLRFQRIVLLLIVAGSLSATTKASQSTVGNTDKEDAMLSRAEVAANRIVRRFHETLDFSGIFVDGFVTEPRLRTRALSFGNPDLLNRFDAATSERMYVSAMTFMHLFEDYVLIQNDNKAPPEVQNLDPKPEFLVSSDTKPPRDLVEANRAIAEVEKVSALYRKYLTQAAFGGPIYRENLRRERKSEKDNFLNVPRIDQGNKKFGIPETIPVYVVRPEVFDYYFIEERGVMKIFYVDILPNFKLF
jgi:hypothetical protein